jgi:glutamine amidotransferase
VSDDVVVVDYGAGNTRSVCAALSRLGVGSVVTSAPDAIRGASHVVLPGVGSARTAMANLERLGADVALRDRFAAGGPTLGICLGLQLALERSEEDGGVAALGLVEGTAVRLDGPRVPRLGWSRVEPTAEAFYFAHAYVARSPHCTATSEGLCVEVRSGAFVGVQFHPEKSGPAGLAFLERCLSPA